MQFLLDNRHRNANVLRGFSVLRHAAGIFEFRFDEFAHFRLESVPIFRRNGRPLSFSEYAPSSISTTPLSFRLREKFLPPQKNVWVDI